MTLTTLPTNSDLHALARRRVEAKQKLSDRKRGGKPASVSPEEIQRRYLGLLGERLVASVLGVEMALDVSHRGDHRANLRTRRGVPVDVITRTAVKNRLYPDLLINVSEKPQPDLALVLVMQPAEPWKDLRILGWVWEYDVRERNQVVQYSRNQSLSFPAQHLQPIETLALTNPWLPPATQEPLF